MTPTARTVQVDLAERSYPIRIGRGLLQANPFNRALRGDQVLIVTNETVAPHVPGTDAHGAVRPPCGDPGPARRRALQDPGDAGAGL
ncbi:MAG: hypothetical protein U5L11_15590 [Arhodomonas sp.]|nr:hypothetical protein [Arhodomonas sp.]